MVLLYFTSHLTFFPHSIKFEPFRWEIYATIQDEYYSFLFTWLLSLPVYVVEHCFIFL